MAKNYCPSCGSVLGESGVCPACGTTNEAILLEVKSSALRGGGLVSHHSVTATNRSLRFKDPKMLGIREDITEIPYNKIDSIKKKGGLRGSTLIMNSGTFGTIELGGISGGDADKIVAIYKKYSASEAATPQSVVEQVSQPAPKEDPMEQLNKLKKMVEAGLITEEEYNTKKAEILAKM
jgi:hypothetical protein